MENTINKMEQGTTPKNSIIFLLSFLLFVSVLIAGFFVYQTQKLVKEIQEIKDTNLVSQSPTSANDPTADWKTVKNTGLGYQIKLPLNWNIVEHSSNFNDVFETYISDTGQRIEINKNKIPKIICKGDCPIIEKTTKTNIGIYEATKYEGYVGEIGGDIAHQYITFNIIGDSYSLDVIFHPSTVNKVLGGEIVSINDQEINLFNQILSTFKFLDDVLDDQITYQTLKFFRPTDWSLWGNSTNTFSFAYDGSKYSDPIENGNTISVNSNNSLGSSFFIKNLNYDGGSRHKFISDNYSLLKTAKSYEKNYLISGKSSLFIYNIDGSGGCSVGVIIVSNTKATLISSQICEDSGLEPILSTFKYTGSEDIPAISAKELQRGWYWGYINQMKINTPSDWVFKEAGKSSCWHKAGVICL